MGRKKKVPANENSFQMQILYRFYFFKIEDYSMPKTESDLVKTTHVFLLVLGGSSNLKNTEQNHLFLLDAL